MGSQTSADMLAAYLGIDTPQASRQLERFSGGMTATLLDSGRLAIGGLGTFSVVHDNAAREMTDEGERFLPPKNRVAFDPRISGLGDAARIAGERMGLTPEDALRFSRALGSTFQQCRKDSVELELRGFGSFATVDGKYGFWGHAALEELLNSAYDGLETIVMQERPVADSRAKVGFSFGKASVGAVATLLLFAGAYFIFRPLPPGSTVATGAGNAVTSVHAITAGSAASVPSVPKIARASFADSVMLGKGRFTVVVATFSSSSTALMELHRLSGLGHRIMIWPVLSGGRKNFRLVTGEFETYRSALDSVKIMPSGLPKSLYIQQASKNVVLYGENGL
jgi:nucleoid DNA-binding protein